MATAIDLGHRASFRLGAVEVRPSSCEVAGAQGTETIEPRVMKVLVALADARGATVTRDDLTRLCWDGRVVGEDSINRVILKIRHLAKGIGAGSFELETIRKVGYRLRADGFAGQEAAPAPSRPKRRLRLRYAAAALIAVASVGGLMLSGGSTSAPRPEPLKPGAKALEPAALDLAMRGASAAFEQTAAQQAQAIRYFRAAIDREPEDSTLWGALAINYVLAVGYTPPEKQQEVLLRAGQAARRSLELNPGEGHALAAAVYLRPTFRNWAEKERLYRRALAKADGGSPAPVIHYARFLASVGRTRDALAQAERAMQIHPLVPWLNVAWIELLQVGGRLEEAERAAEKATKLWPRNHDLWITHFFLLAFNGSTDAAVAMVDDEAGWPERVRASDMRLLRSVAAAIASGSPAQADAVLADYARLAREGQAYSEQAIRVAARLGRTDEALRFAEALYLGDAPAVSKRFADHDEYGWRGERSTAPLFLNPSPVLWSDPRALALAGRIGLVAYWRQAGAPDFCREAAARAGCRGLGIAGT